MLLPQEGWSAIAGFSAGVVLSTGVLLRHSVELSVAVSACLAAGAGIAYVRATTPFRHSAFSPAAALGIAFGSGLSFAVLVPENNWGYYVCSVAFFHISEYITTALFNNHRLSFDSFLLNHSTEYGLAMLFSWVEFWGELYFLPPPLKAIKTWLPAVRLGLLLTLAGDFTRKLAMFTARANFSHVISTSKAAGHELVTHGVYAVSRHPSYMGWFWWSVGSQVLLCNPIATLAFAAASFTFFRERIDEEERLLLNFFGPKYDAYQSRVGTGIPFIAGVRAVEAQRRWWAANVVPN